MPVEVHYRTLTVQETFHELMEAVGLLGAPEMPTLDSTLDEFNEIMGDVDYSDMLDGFGFQATDEWWKKWMPHDSIRMICEDIAARVEVPMSGPVTILGKSCKTAGHFTMMKQLLVEAGADVTKLSPSTPLTPYLNRHSVLFQRVALSHRGRLPSLDTAFSPILLPVGALLALWMAILSTYAFGNSFPVSFGIGVGTFLAFWILCTYLQPRRSRLRFPGIVTFRDFVRAAIDLPPKKVRQRQ